MARKKKEEEKKPAGTPLDQNAHILGAGEVEEQFITDTLETNYMPYAMSVIMSRAIPEIDGFKPSHRKLLYTMYKMGLLTGARSKSANIVGATMKLNPHGDAAIYETMVRLTRGNEALLHPYVDSKGNFGKAYSKNMQSATKMRSVLRKLAATAEKYRCAVILIGHMNKGNGTNPLYRGLGSIDIAAIARSVLMISRDEVIPLCGICTLSNPVLLQRGQQLLSLLETVEGLSGMANMTLTPQNS